MVPAEGLLAEDLEEQVAAVVLVGLEVPVAVERVVPVAAVQVELVAAGALAEPAVAAGVVVD